MASVRKLDPADPKSPWVCEYTDAAGKRRRKTPKTGLKKDAETIARKIEREMEDLQHTPVSVSALVKVFADLYVADLDLRERDGRIGYSHARKQRRMIRKHLVPTLGTRVLAELKITDVLGLYERMREGGASASTAKEYLRYFAFMEDFAIRRGLTKVKVFSEAMRELRGIVAPRIRTFTLEDVRRLLDTAEKRRKFQREQGRDMVRCAVNLGAFCGLRWGEVFGLTVSAIDFSSNVLRIRHSLSERGLKSTKTAGGQRDIPLPRHIAELLREWMREHYVANPDGLLFTTPVTSPPGSKRAGMRPKGVRHVTHPNFYLKWRDLLIDAGLGKKTDTEFLHFHALRHFASALMVEHGIPLTDVASLMGHRSFDLTLQVYAHPIVGGHKRHSTFERMSLTLGRDENAISELAFL